MDSIGVAPDWTPQPHRPPPQDQAQHASKTQSFDRAGHGHGHAQFGIQEWQGIIEWIKYARYGYVFKDSQA